MRVAWLVCSCCVCLRARLRSYTDYPFLGQTATPEVPAVDPYAVKGKN